MSGLSPAFEVSYALNPAGEWTSRHQMSINGKREGFGREALLALATAAGIKMPQANQMLDRVIVTVRRGLNLPKRRVCRVNASTP